MTLAFNFHQPTNNFKELIYIYGGMLLGSLWAIQGRRETREPLCMLVGDQEPCWRSARERPTGVRTDRRIGP